MKVYGKNLSFSGYIAVQEGLQLKPDELRGILIRIKNVGIGYYDQSMLDYRFNEGPRTRWLTGEIYVDQGLEDALNVDRDSFNRFHPEFRALQSHIHSVLREEVFPAVYKNIDVRSKERKTKISTKRSGLVKSVVQNHDDRSVRIVRTARRATQTPRTRTSRRRIFDQHTHRAMLYIQRRAMSDTLSGTTLAGKKHVYEAYKQYRDFVAEIGGDLRKIDRAIYTFGQFLKVTKPYCDC